ncbi:hypothetical protein STEG23_003045 [Scotinomys teguina]
MLSWPSLRNLGQKDSSLKGLTHSQHYPPEQFCLHSFQVCLPLLLRSSTDVQLQLLLNSPYSLITFFPSTNTNACTDTEREAGKTVCLYVCLYVIVCMNGPQFMRLWSIAIETVMTSQVKRKALRKTQETLGAGTASQYHAIPDTDKDVIVCGRHCVCIRQHNAEVTPLTQKLTHYLVSPLPQLTHYLVSPLPQLTHYLVSPLPQLLHLFLS